MGARQGMYILTKDLRKWMKNEREQESGPFPAQWLV
jgi:hypothetical protein